METHSHSAGSESFSESGQPYSNNHSSWSVDELLVDHRNKVSSEKTNLIAQPQCLKETLLGIWGKTGESMDNFVSRLTDERTRLEEIARQNDQRQYSLERLLPQFADVLEQADTPDESLQSQLVELYCILRAAFWENRFFDLIASDNRTDDVKRVDQVKTLMDIYTSKIKDIKSDSDLSERNQMDSAEYLRRLRERDVALLEGEA